MYKERLVDSEIERRIKVFGAVLIYGVKGCGKTETATRKVKTIYSCEDIKVNKQLQLVEDINPKQLLEGELPILYDEWTNLPKIWGLVRKDIDDTSGKGKYILTESHLPKVNPPHTGTMRISQIYMRPMSLYENGYSKGGTSFSSLFEDNNDLYCQTNRHSLGELAVEICRGGWPKALEFNDLESQLNVAKERVKEICNKDISEVDGVKRNPDIALALLKAYSRRIGSVCSTREIFKEVKETYKVSDSTLYSYLDSLNKLFIIEEVEPWHPRLLTDSSIRSKKMRCLVDPSLAVAALDLKIEDLLSDYDLLDKLFEALCYRDIKIYADKIKADVLHFEDRSGLKISMVLRQGDGRYGLIETSLGDEESNKRAAKKLMKMIRLIEKANYEYPKFLVILTPTGFTERIRGGIKVITIDNLKD